MVTMSEPENLNLPQRALLKAVGAYQAVVSPLLPDLCRFHPSCSCYAQDAIVVHGALRGGMLALVRLSRCHPLSGGFDPVPPPRHRRHSATKGSE
jgi:putative membrane protein insertion efficiency factor